LEKGAEGFDLQNIGCHTLRKTYGYMIYNASDKDPVGSRSIRWTQKVRNNTTKVSNIFGVM